VQFRNEKAIANWQDDNAFLQAAERLDRKYALTEAPGQQQTNDEEIAPNQLATPGYSRLHDQFDCVMPAERRTGTPQQQRRMSKAQRYHPPQMP
jgi:hypothetical protein